MGNILLSSAAGAATMTHSTVIKAVREGYTLASILGEPTIVRALRRAWTCGNEALIVDHLETLEEIVLLRNEEGSYPLIERARAAANSVRALGTVLS